MEIWIIIVVCVIIVIPIGIVIVSIKNNLSMKHHREILKEYNFDEAFENLLLVDKTAGEVTPFGIRMEKPGTAEPVVQKASSSKRRIILAVVITIALILGAMWGYGYFKAAQMVDEGLPIIGAAIMVESMNPVSASGFKHYLRTQTDLPDRISDLDRILDGFSYP